MVNVLFGLVHIGRLPTEQQRHEDLLKLWKKIMATLNEVVEQLNQANASLVAANSIINDTKTVIVKIGTETDRLKDQIANLPPSGDASPELVAALDAIKATVASTGDLVSQAKDAAGVVDAKVDDAP